MRDKSWSIVLLIRAISADALKTTYRCQGKRERKKKIKQWFLFTLWWLLSRARLRSVPAKRCNVSQKKKETKKEERKKTKEITKKKERRRNNNNGISNCMLRAACDCVSVFLFFFFWKGRQRIYFWDGVINTFRIEDDRASFQRFFFSSFHFRSVYFI